MEMSIPEKKKKMHQKALHSSLSVKDAGAVESCQVTTGGDIGK